MLAQLSEVPRTWPCLSVEAWREEPLKTTAMTTVKDFNHLLDTWVGLHASPGMFIKHKENMII